MTQFDQFLHSVQGGFAANRATDMTRLGLLFVAVVALSLGLAAWARRRKSQRELATRTLAVLHGAGLFSRDLDDLVKIASAGGLPVLEIMTGLAAFEHATASLLVGEVSTLQPIAGSWSERIHCLRKALGFSPLSAHLWLLSTRELVVGDSVATGGIKGHVVEVNESTFAVDWPMAATLVEGGMSIVTIDRIDDARYASRVRLLTLQALLEVTLESGERSAGRRAFFAHDEQPERQQDREYMRLRIDAPVRVQFLDPPTKAARQAPAAPSVTVDDGTSTAAPAATPPSIIAGTMVDVSAGGLSMDLPVSPDGPVVLGARVVCSFTLDDHATFDAVTATVMAAGAVIGAPPGVQHLRLSFGSLEEGARDRLASALAKHQAAPPQSPAAT